MGFAENTKVPVSQSRAEIEGVLTRFGCDAFMYGYEGRRAVIGFKIQGRSVRFELPLPTADEPKIKLTPAGRMRAKGDIDKAVAQEERRRWRSLGLAIKAKLAAVDDGIVTFEEEFLAHFVMPDGQRFAMHALPALDRAYETGTPPLLLPPATDGD